MCIIGHFCLTFHTYTHTVGKERVRVNLYSNIYKHQFPSTKLNVTEKSLYDSKESRILCMKTDIYCLITYNAVDLLSPLLFSPCTVI